MTAAATTRVVHARAPGKINVFMKVGAQLDDGYHEVATAYQAISLYEEVFARDADDFSVRFSGPIDTSGLATDGSNLAIKAARLLARTTDYRGGVALEIEKNVPIAGGMGGGSADAAATLIACDHLWGTRLGRDELQSLAAELGADVPFALLGGTAVGTGRGDRLSPALAQGTFHWVLALADGGLSTPEVYAELDRHRERHASDIAPAPERAQPSRVEVLQAPATSRGPSPARRVSVQTDLQAPALATMASPSWLRTLEQGGATRCGSRASSRAPGRPVALLVP